MELNQAKLLLQTFFSGQATPYQKRLLADWLREEQHYEAYYQALHEWEKANPQVFPDIATEWQELMPRLNDPLPRPNHDIIQALPATRFAFRGWLAAASVALLMGLGWWQQERLLYRTYSTAYGETRRVDLPDGSRVTLNANSSLRFPRFLSLLPRREARLSGEAEFSVVHTVDNRPFVVLTPDQLEVRVLGTEFIVYSRERGSQVVLNRGRVTLRSLKSLRKPLAIHPGDVVTVDLRGNIQVQEKQPVANYAAWKKQRFVFDRTPLRDIARQIQERFGVTVHIPDVTLADRQISGNYPAQTADEVLSMLTQLLNVRADKQTNGVILRATD
ncbi:MAG: FecR domain-containing protein [Bacteroidetes bacterium]|nr:FecR domain-containing protein [Fibrella sp.]